MLAWIAGGWLSGLFIGAQWRPEAAPLFLSTAIVGAFTLLTHGRELGARLWIGPLAWLAFLAGLGLTTASTEPCAVTGEARLSARVESVRHGFGDAQVRLLVLEGQLLESAQPLPGGLRIRTYMPSARTPPPQALLRLTADLRPRSVLQNPSPHPRLSPALGRACSARIYDPESIERLETPPWLSRIDRARARARKRMNEMLPQEVAGVARALVLGDGAALEYSQRQTIAAVGLAHLFAVSGLHVALVSGTLVRALGWLLAGVALRFDARRLAAAIGIPLTLLHAVFAGGSPSAWRAAWTAAFTWMLIVIDRRPSSAAITAAAALMLSVPEPSMALRPAFLLSIVATSAILSAPRPSRTQRWFRLRSSALISARTLVATTPMVWWWFGGVPLIGWLTNILVLPLGSWLVIPLAHLFALSADSPGLAQMSAAALTMATNLLLSICDAFAPFAFTRRLPPLDLAQGILVLLACILLLLARSWRQRLTVVLVASLLWLGADQRLRAREHPRDLLRVSFVDVGQGDASLVDLPDGRLALIDTGQGGRHPAGRTLRGLLSARRRTRIDLLVISHGHPDHYGGLAPLLEEFEVGEIWLNGQLLVEERDGSMTRLVNRALARGAKVRFAPELCEKPSRFGEARIEVLWPCPRYDPRLGLNDNSLTLRIELGHRSFLFTGDLESEAERLLVDSGRVQQADVLKVAHHGSKTSSTEQFLAAARPSLAVISSGAANRYGHPSPAVVERLREAGAELHRTDIQGGLIVSTDGERLDLVR